MHTSFYMIIDLDIITNITVYQLFDLMSPILCSIVHPLGNSNATSVVVFSDDLKS